MGGASASPRGRSRRRGVLTFVRYWLPALLLLAAPVLLAIKPDSTGLEGAAMLIGSGLSVLLFNVLVRMGNEGDRERTREEEARRFYDAHGRWPDER